MVGMIVVRPRREHEVGLPFADLPDDLLAHLEIGDELAIMVVEHHVLDADAAAGLLRLGAPPHGELAAALLVVTGIAVGDGDEPHLVAERRPFGRRAAGADVTVVGVRTERDDAERLILGGDSCRREQDERTAGNEHARAKHRNLHGGRHHNARLNPEAACGSPHSPAAERSACPRRPPLLKCRDNVRSGACAQSMSTHGPRDAVVDRGPGCRNRKLRGGTLRSVRAGDDAEGGARLVQLADPQLAW